MDRHEHSRGTESAMNGSNGSGGANGSGAGNGSGAANGSNGSVAASRSEGTGSGEIDRVLPAMRGLRSRARVTNLSRAAQLERSLEYAAEGRLDEAGRAQAAAVAHQLIGSAGTFGFAEASRRAMELKDFFALAQIEDDDVRAARVRLLALRDDLQNGEGEIEL